MKINIFKKLQVVFLVVSASLMVGCSSIDAHAGGGYGKPFSGTALSVARQPCYLRADITSIALYPLSLIDIHLSLATDVVFLPVDLIMVATPTTSYGGVVSLGCPSGSMI
ncbi:YceK/YidQ family lipoprotein [Vibrio parahaemolyticus]|uniref:YceK/YidQ family lipoprotein n=2 Tax=Vibrio parahaemolyticus TaxID=670 RepID=UPI0004263921|nr:YceK/YidQ family lipoprotein [Vibrio parahaemolyticus]HCG9767172.1 YceK/YidQ family lipoprotein [Vibrio parahaemolyticus]HCH3932355.1 YceK/YidQ family lipoprotein [Vibrio parahaemolyticus]HCH5880535.1 YceK/YidQ family lipoprotein [Vibrio parahaemolyticus]HCM1184487.1 YceK/YidQ family lipoprotein [Vibrio parahaemolyticus]